MQRPFVSNEPNNTNNTNTMMRLPIPPPFSNSNSSGNGNGSGNGDDNDNAGIKIADDLLSKELLLLSLEDRNDIQEEIHGVKCIAPIETPQMIAAAVIELSNVLNNDDIIPRSQKQAYILQTRQERQSQNSNKPYINSNEFYLRFLRRELFDIKKAAFRMVKHLDCIKELFGNYALERPIRLSDFSRKELQIIRKGYVQYMPFRDRAGRRISVVFPVEFIKNTDYNLRMKIILYLSYVESESDIEAQRRGIVMILWSERSYQNEVLDTAKQWTKGGLRSYSGIGQQQQQKRWKVHDVSLLRYSAIHFCSPDTPIFSMGRSLYTIALSRKQRSRLQTHVGEPVELRYSLNAYGVPTDDLPITWSGSVKNNYQKQWMKLRSFIERERIDYNNNCRSQSRQSQSQIPPPPPPPMLIIVECPSVTDVIFRHGTNMSTHPGNVRFRSLIQLKCEEYINKKRDSEKQNNVVSSTPSPTYSGLSVYQFTTRELVLDLINEIHINTVNGRFLIWNPLNNNSKGAGGDGLLGYWIELIDKKQIFSKIEYIVNEFKYSSTKSQSINRHQEHAIQAPPTTTTSTSTSTTTSTALLSTKPASSRPTMTTTTTHLQSDTSMFESQDGNKRKRTNNTNTNTNTKNGDNLNYRDNDSSSSLESATTECFGLDLFCKK